MGSQLSDNFDNITSIFCIMYITILFDMIMLLAECPTYGLPE